MKFTVITHVRHKKHKDKIYAYAPYVREMNLWFKYADKPVLVAPLYEEEPEPIHIPYNKKPEFRRVPAFSLTSASEIFKTIFKLPLIFWKVFRAMQHADHIHLRLPGNMGLVGSIVQILFPRKPKTVKYAGNWDPEAPAPWSYRLQKAIVANPFLSRNMKVLVYGEWPGQSKNIVPFFTASYTEKEITEVPVRELKDPIRLIYAGALAPGKRPMLSVQTAEELLRRGRQVRLDIYGDGAVRSELEKYVNEHPELQKAVTLHGNRSPEELKNAFQQAHFLVFASKSEGWPKVVAEAMVWKCLPLTTPVSAVPYMLGYGERGSLIKPDPKAIADEIEYYLEHPGEYNRKAQAAHDWAKQFTLEKFEEAVSRFLT